MKEDLFISKITSILENSAAYIGDDTAYIKEKDLIITQDTLVEDVHFRTSTISAFDLGQKSIAVNLSDIAAAGGIAKYITISLSMPSDCPESFLSDFYHGVNKICQEYNVIVVGGDLTKSDKITISVTALGEAKGIVPAKRSNAMPDHIVAVTGIFGSSAIGLHILENDSASKTELPAETIKRFLTAHTIPVPQLNTGRKIAEMLQPSPTMMDTSDGLADALIKIARRSRVAIEINLEKVPTDVQFDDACRILGLNKETTILFGGEDYELVSTMSRQKFEQLISAGVPIVEIGRVTGQSDSHEVTVQYKEKTFKLTDQTLKENIFSHFEETL